MKLSDIITNTNPKLDTWVDINDLAAAAAAAAYAAYAAAYAAAAAAAADAAVAAEAAACAVLNAKRKNQLQTAEICRELIGEMIIERVNELLTN